jgi:ADP-ribosyl-[dinitrogen reductase] hydrolase
MDTWNAVEGGILGLLIGDACGVPYEFKRPSELPPIEKIDMIPPSGFWRSYSHIPLGTWSDDGAQALCLLESILECGRYHAFDFAQRLLRWHDQGHMAVGRYVFDIGNQTSVSVDRLKKGMTTDHSGLCGERNNGNGSLMRVLPLVLLHRSNDLSLVMNAHRQSKLTHGHPRAQVCCGVYCLWARRELQKHPDPWESALQAAIEIYADEPVFMKELRTYFLSDKEFPTTGSGYVVDSLHSARKACEASDYASIVRNAISMGNDTDTTAAIAGGIAGIRYGRAGIPVHWVDQLRGWDILSPILNRLYLRILSNQEYSRVFFSSRKMLEHT